VWPLTLTLSPPRVGRGDIAVVDIILLALWGFPSPRASGERDRVRGRARIAPHA